MELPVKVFIEQVKRGNVLLKQHFHGIDHPKMFVVMDVSEDTVTGFFFVNSKINTNVINKPAQIELQYPIKVADYSFLKHDSFICASSLQRACVNDIAADFQSGEVRLVGKLLDADMAALLAKLNASKTYSAYIKRTFFS